VASESVKTGEAHFFSCVPMFLKVEGVAADDGGASFFYSVSMAADGWRGQRHRAAVWNRQHGRRRKPILLYTNRGNGRWRGKFFFIPCPWQPTDGGARGIVRLRGIGDVAEGGNRFCCTQIRVMVDFSCRQARVPSSVFPVSTARCIQTNVCYYYVPC
jgi:hypothetical protein